MGTLRENHFEVSYIKLGFLLTIEINKDLSFLFTCFEYFLATVFFFFSWVFHYNYINTFVLAGDVNE